MFRRTQTVALALFILGLIGFGWPLLLGSPGTAWQAYMVNFLLFSAIAQGAVAISAMANTVNELWSSRVTILAESFTAFFPVSFILFLGLFAGREFVFPWLHQDLHGQKEFWLNLPFLFSRDMGGFIILYGLGFVYLYYTLWFRIGSLPANGGLRSLLLRLWRRREPDPKKYEYRRYVLGVLYLIAFGITLSLFAYDLVMAAEPVWYSTLFGAYAFVKAIYVGIGGLIILCASLHLNPNLSFELSSKEYIDIGKLMLAFCLLWADFFYCQLVVIWYGNIPEETSYVITRTILTPWKWVAATVFVIAFVVPFATLLNQRIKAFPKAMICLCGLVLIGMWLEHYLLLGPALNPSEGQITMSMTDVMITLGFIGLLMLTVIRYLNLFPEMLKSAGKVTE